MTTHARNLRQNMTNAEQRMWYYLRNRRLAGYKFIRQHTIGKYIVDFVCRDKSLIIELNGGRHMDAIDYDRRRSAYLESMGYQILRVWNHEVFNNIDEVTRQIIILLEQA